MPDRITIAITVLDILAILMTGGWIIYGIYKGVEFFEIIYNYIYVIVILFSLILNIVKINTSQNQFS